MKQKKFKSMISLIMSISVVLFSLTSCEDLFKTEETIDNLPNITGFPIVGTNQTISFNNSTTISTPSSVDSFFGLDYPELDKENWRAWINISKGDDGNMQFKKQAFNSWPA
jgi:hypothetical protein